MIKLTSLIENLLNDDDGYYYHVTLMPYVKSILKYGLTVRGTKRTVTNYKEYSKNKIFFCNFGSLEWWKWTIEQHAFHEFDNESYHEVAVFRIKKENLPNISIDKVGSEDSKGNAYYVSSDIPPNILELI